MSEKMEILMQNKTMRVKFGEHGIETSKKYSKENIVKIWDVELRNIVK